MMDDKLLLIQIAFSMVSDSLDYTSMSIDNRVQEEGVFTKDERDTNKTCQ